MITSSSSTSSFGGLPPLPRKVEGSKLSNWCCPSTPPMKVRRGHLLACRCEKQGAPLLIAVFFSPLATNVAICAKFDMKKERKATMCNYSPRKRRIKKRKKRRRRGRDEEKKVNKKEKRRRKERNEDSLAMEGVDNSIVINVGSRAFF